MSPSATLRARAAADAVVRGEALEAAARLLAEAGPQALTMRRIATALGASTTVLYTVFGGKDGIADALYREGFERLRRRLEAARDRAAAAHPAERLAAVGGAYRQSALADRGFYAVMFSNAVPGYTPSPESVAAGQRSLAVLVDAVADCMAAGVMRPGAAAAAGVAAAGVAGAGAAAEVARMLHAAAHGAVSLELSGHFPDAATAERCFHALTQAAVSALVQNGAPSPDAGCIRAGY